MPQDFVFIQLLFLLQHEFIKSSVHCREIADLLIADQIYAIERSIQRLQPAQIAMIAHEIAQKPSRYLAALGAAASGYTRHCRIKALARKFPVFFNKFFYALPFLP